MDHLANQKDLLAHLRNPLANQRNPLANQRYHLVNLRAARDHQANQIKVNQRVDLEVGAKAKVCSKQENYQKA